MGMDTQKDTVSIHFVRCALTNLTPAAAVRVLGESGISPQLLAVAHARIPAQSFASLWLAVARELDDEFFGLDRRRMKVGSFAFLCHATISATSLEGAIRRSLTGFALLLDDIRGDLGYDADGAVISLTNRMRVASSRRFADETFLVMLHGLLSWLIGRRIPLDVADFAYSKPGYFREYHLMYCQHLRFDADQTAIRFNARLLRAPIVQNTVTLKQFLRTAPQSVFLKYKNEESLNSQVRRRLRHGFKTDDWPSLQQVAEELHVAATTLRRRLAAEGSSFQTIKDQLRHDAAIHYLCNSALNISDIAATLGFQDASAFHRAFRKWSGAQPGEYRRLQAGKTTSQHSR